MTCDICDWTEDVQGIGSTPEIYLCSSCEKRQQKFGYHPAIVLHLADEARELKEAMTAVLDEIRSYREYGR